MKYFRAVVQVLSSSGRSDVSTVIPRAVYPCQLRVGVRPLCFGEDSDVHAHRSGLEGRLTNHAEPIDNQQIPRSTVSIGNEVLECGFFPSCIESYIMERGYCSIFAVT